MLNIEADLKIEKSHQSNDERLDDVDESECFDLREKINGDRPQASLCLVAKHPAGRAYLRSEAECVCKALNACRVLCTKLRCR